MRRRLALALVAAGALVAAVALLPPNVFWITDEGTKFIQLQSLARFGRIDVVYPGAALDPAMRLLPDAGFHLMRVGGRVYSLFLPYFAMLNLIPFRIFGIYGIYLVPALGALISAMLTGKMSGPAAALILLFGTPVFFYGITYWEHTAALALSTAAVMLLRRTSVSAAIAAGVLLALSTLLREEGYVFTVAVVLALIIRDRSPRAGAVVAAAFAVVMAPAWLWHLRLFGSPLGLHGAVYADFASRSSAILRGAFDHLLRFRPQVWVSLLLVAPQFAAPFVPRRWHRPVLLLALVAALAAVLLMTTDSDRIAATATSNGLLPSLPFVTLALLGWREGERFLQAICALFIAGACLTLSGAGSWIIWGPRHFFPIFPLLAVLSFEAWERLERPALAIGLAIAAVLIQANGIADLTLKKRGTERIRAAIVADATTVVVTDVFWLPQEMASLFYEKTFLFARTDADAAAAIAALRSRGVERFTFVAARHYRRLSNQALAPVVGMATRRARVVTPGMDFMDVMVMSCDLRQRR